MNVKYKILVTPKEACDILKRDSESSECEFIFTDGRIEDQNILNSYLKKVDAAILDLEKINDETLSGVNNLKVISRFGVGHDNISKESLKAKNIPLTITYGTSSDAVARHALALIMACQHNLIGHTQNARHNLWNRVQNISYKENKVGIIGHGQIGKALEASLKLLGYQCLFYSRSKKDVSSSLEEIFENCKIISIHLAKNIETTGFLSREQFLKMRGNIIVNTSRGGIVNEEDMLWALDSGHVEQYATDVFENEPLSGISSVLGGHSKVICTPHLASFDRQTAMAMSHCALENCLCVLKGKNLSSEYKIMI